MQTSSLAAAGTSGGLIVLQWLVAPEWPPPLPVLTVFVGAMLPVCHLLGRALYKRLTIVADQIDGPDEPAPILGPDGQPLKPEGGTV